MLMFGSASQNQFCSSGYLITNDTAVTHKLKLRCFFDSKKKVVILTKDNLSKRNWQGCKYYCCFCSNYESIQHLFFSVNMLNFSAMRCHMVFGISPLRTTANLLGIGISSVEKI